LVETKTGSVTFARDPSVGLKRVWPDTLQFLPFDDATDQEIGLERGEADLAIFWPGELSRQARSQARWRGFPYGTLRRGVLAGLQDSSDQYETSPADRQGLVAAAVDSPVVRLNREIFHGDLLPVEGAPMGAAPFWTGNIPSGVVQRSLTRTWPSRDTASARAMQLFYLDAPADSADSLRTAGALALAHRRREDKYYGSYRFGQGPVIVTPFYRVRCPLVCEPNVRRLVQAIGADEVAALVLCGTAK
jgi:hypothetical protein